MLDPLDVHIERVLTERRLGVLPVERLVNDLRALGRAVTPETIERIVADSNGRLRLIRPWSGLLRELGPRAPARGGTLIVRPLASGSGAGRPCTAPEPDPVVTLARAVAELAHALDLESLEDRSRWLRMYHEAARLVEPTSRRTTPG